MNIDNCPFTVCLLWCISRISMHSTDQQKPINNLFAFQICSRNAMSIPTILFVICYLGFTHYLKQTANYICHSGFAASPKPTKLHIFSIHTRKWLVIFTVYYLHFRWNLGLYASIVVDLSNRNGKSIKLLYKVDLYRSHTHTHTSGSSAETLTMFREL